MPRLMDMTWEQLKDLRVGPFYPAPAPAARPAPHPKPKSKFMTAKEAADYLNRSPSWFKKHARMIKQQRGTGLYLAEDLDSYAAGTGLKRRRPPQK